MLSGIVRIVERGLELLALTQYNVSSAVPLVLPEDATTATRVDRFVPPHFSWWRRETSNFKTRGNRRSTASDCYV